MRLLIISFLLLIMNKAMAQSNYTKIKDEKKDSSLIFKGILKKEDVEQEKSFGWYSINNKNYQPNEKTLKILIRKKNDLHFVVFGGTWCGDTQNIIPEFFKLMELASINDSTISFFGVDRKKESINNLSAAFHITNVPTIIVLKAGKEIGRVIEYGKSGDWEKDLRRIIK